MQAGLSYPVSSIWTFYNRLLIVFETILRTVFGTILQALQAKDYEKVE